MVFKILIFKADDQPTPIQDTQNKHKRKGFFKSTLSRQELKIACPPDKAKLPAIAHFTFYL